MIYKDIMDIVDTMDIMDIIDTNTDGNIQHVFTDEKENKVQILSSSFSYVLQILLIMF